jgi:hypothetical protein
MASMFKRIWSNLIDNCTAGPSIHLQQRFQVGSASFFLPFGWQPLKNSQEILTACSADGRQRATISVVHFESEVTFDSFKALCEKRLTIEKQVLAEGHVESDPPVAGGDTYSLLFSGRDKQNDRVFLGYLSLKHRELITVYVEGVGVSPAEHEKSFTFLLRGLATK